MASEGEVLLAGVGEPQKPDFRWLGRGECSHHDPEPLEQGFGKRDGCGSVAMLNAGAGGRCGGRRAG